MFLFEGFFSVFLGGGGQREGCEKEVQILEEIISQEKKRPFLMETDKATKRATERKNFTGTEKSGDWLTT